VTACALAPFPGFQDKQPIDKKPTEPKKSDAAVGSAIKALEKQREPR